MQRISQKGLGGGVGDSSGHRGPGEEDCGSELPETPCPL